MNVDEKYDNWKLFENNDILKQSNLSWLNNRNRTYECSNEINIVKNEDNYQQPRTIKPRHQKSGGNERFLFSDGGNERLFFLDGGNERIFFSVGEMSDFFFQSGEMSSSLD